MKREELIALEELARREREALNLFRPLPHQVPIFTSRARELLIVGGSRAGKSMCMAAEISAAALGVPIIGPDGKPLPMKYRKPPLTIWLIGKEENHSSTWHRLLLEDQYELKIVRDDQTGQWRAFNPLTDKGRTDFEIMGPFIPHRCIEGGYKKGIFWEKPRDKQFNNIRLTNGTVLKFYASSSEVKKGDPVDIVAIDEHIKYSEHYNEWQVRLSDRKGRIIWAICPDTKRNAALNALQDRCKKHEGKENPWFQRIVLRFTDNPYIDEEEKQIRRESMDRRHWLNRDAGELLEGDSTVYPEWDENRHGSPSIHEKLDDAADKVLRESGGAIPDDWCRELILDPGSAHPGVLMCALPPPSLGVDCGIIYDELYLPNSDPMTLAEELAKKTRGQHFYRFIIDGRAAMQRTIGTALGKNTYILYAEAFKHFGIACELTGSNFVLSPCDWLAGIQAVRGRLANSAVTGRPWLRFVRNRCYNFCRMMESYEHAIDAHGFIEDKPAPKQIDCLTDCVRYWVASEPFYSEPPKREQPAGSAWELYLQIEAEKEQRRGRTVHLGAGAVPN